jgi:PPOX class probable F420-dependent enzyme
MPILGPMNANPIADLDDWARELLDSARVARLGLLDDRDRPRVLPVTFALAGGYAWSAIDRKPKRSGREPARLRYLRRRPHAALTVDHYDDDWSRLAWVQLLGEITVHDPADTGEALEALAAKYEPYRRESPPGPLLRLEPDRVLSWQASSEAPR